MITNRFILKKLKTSEIHLFVNQIFEISQNKKFQYFSFSKISNLEQCKTYIIWLLNNSDYYGIYFKNDLNKLIGCIGYHTNNYLAYVINEKLYNQKILSEVLPIFIEYGKLIHKFSEIKASIEKENIASIKLVEKFKFLLTDEIQTEYKNRIIYKKILE